MVLQKLIYVQRELFQFIDKDQNWKAEMRRMIKEREHIALNPIWRSRSSMSPSSSRGRELGNDASTFIVPPSFADPTFAEVTERERKLDTYLSI